VKNRSILLISDFTVSGLAPFLRREIPVEVAPFDQVASVLLDPSQAAWREEPNLALVWTRPDGVVRSFGRLLRGEDVSLDQLLEETEQFIEQLTMAADRVEHLFVASWTVPPYVRGLGLLSLDPERGHAHHLLRMNLRLMELARENPKVSILDSGRWLAHAGVAGCNPKLWHMGKIAFGPAVMAQAGADVVGAICAIEGRTRKVVVVDLDDTLWGGIVGDEGWEKLRLGGHSPIGEGFAAFQSELKALQRRGVLLAIVSKNTEEVALEAIDRHPEMVLQRDDFVAWRINWSDKAQNIRDLAEELNLGLDSFVFIDDHPAERARVRAALPAVFVPDWPDDKLLYAQALTELTCFDPATLTAEDRARSEMYRAEQQRNKVQDSAQTVEAYLESLQLRVTAERLNASNLSRAVQLLNKTNQMNLATRRMTEAQFDAIHTDRCPVFVFRVADRFGEYGLTGLASITVNGNTATVTDFVVSCRVMGRGVEEAMLHVITQFAGRVGANKVEATYLPTDRNAPIKAFCDKNLGTPSSSADDHTSYSWSTAGPTWLAQHIQLDWDLAQ